MILWKLRQWYEQNQPTFFRLAVIGGALFASAVMGMLSYRLRDKAILLPLLPFAAMGVFLLVQYPSLGLAAMVFCSFLVPFNLGTGTQTRLSITLLILAVLIGLWVLDLVVRKGRFEYTRPLLPLIFLVSVAVLAFISGNTPWFSFAQHAPIASQIGGLSVFILSVACFLVTSQRIKDIFWLQIITFTFMFAAGVLLVDQLFAELRHANMFFLIKGASGSMFWTWAVAISFSQAAYNKKLPDFWRLALGGITGLALLIGLYYSRSWTSGWMPSLVAIGIIVLLGSPKLAVAMGVVGGLVGLAGYQKIVGLVVIDDTSYSIMTRVEAWRILGRIIQVNPILGLGPSNYYFYTSLFPILGWYVNFNSHNNYVDLIAQTGLLGLGCFLWFMGESAALGLGLRTKTAEGFETAYTYGAIGGLAATLVAAMLGDWVLPFVYNIGLEGMRASLLPWVFLGGLAALNNIVKNRAAEG